jgi:transposase
MGDKDMTVRDFFKRFPTDDACLDHVMNVRFGMRHECGKCHKDATFHRISGRNAYACAACGTHVYPCAGTIFKDSRTSLQTWFYAIYLFVVTRHGVSGKELERNLGVTYKCAWRMAKQIRILMGGADVAPAMLAGHIEIDETYFGPRRPGAGMGATAGGTKTIIMGMKQRGGPMRNVVIPNVRRVTLQPIIEKHVEKGAFVSTDELHSYRLLESHGYQHGTVRHAIQQYADGDTHVNTVESFWGTFKRSVRSTHIHISKKYLELYLGEFAFRASNSVKRNAMFDLLIGAV